MRARAFMLVAVLHVVLMLVAWLAPLAHAQDEDVLEKVESTACRIKNTLQTLAYVAIIIAAFVGVIHYVTGRGPEWITRAVIAAIVISVVMWIIGQFIAAGEVCKAG